MSCLSSTHSKSSQELYRLIQGRVIFLLKAALCKLPYVTACVTDPLTFLTLVESMLTIITYCFCTNFSLLLECDWTDIV